MVREPSEPRVPAANWRYAYAQRGYPKWRSATDATPIIIAMVMVGATIVFAVSGAAWRLGSRLGAVEKGVAVCESDIRDLNRKVDRILERLPPLSA